ncbi:MAG: hypothetical protein R3F62_31670, partial [Planctomycetota bacterium]
RDPGRLSLVQGGRMWLGPDSKVACAEAWTLDAGSCVLQGRELPSLLVDGAEISPVGEAELRVEVARRTAEVDVYAGKVYIRDTRGDSLDLAAGRGVRVRRGRLGDPRPAQLPAGLRQALAPQGQRVWAEAWDAQAKPRYGLLLGELSPEGLRGATKPIAPVERAICVAGHEARGLCAAPAGGRLYLRLVLEDRHPITLQLSSPDQSRSWRRTVEGHPGVNHVDLALDELPALGGGAAIQAGQLLDLLSVQAGGAGETIPLVLEYVQVYVP